MGTFHLYVTNLSSLGVGIVQFMGRGRPIIEKIPRPLYKGVVKVRITEKRILSEFDAVRLVFLES